MQSEEGEPQPIPNKRISDLMDPSQQHQASDQPPTNTIDETTTSHYATPDVHGDSTPKDNAPNVIPSTGRLPSHINSRAPVPAQDHQFNQNAMKYFKIKPPLPSASTYAHSLPQPTRIYPTPPPRIGTSNPLSSSKRSAAKLAGDKEAGIIASKNSILYHTALVRMQEALKLLDDKVRSKRKWVTIDDLQSLHDHFDHLIQNHPVFNPTARAAKSKQNILHAIELKRSLDTMYHQQSRDKEPEPLPLVPMPPLQPYRSGRTPNNLNHQYRQYEDYMVVDMDMDSQGGSESAFYSQSPWSSTLPGSSARNNNIKLYGGSSVPGAMPVPPQQQHSALTFATAAGVAADRPLSINESRPGFELMTLLSRHADDQAQHLGRMDKNNAAGMMTDDAVVGMNREHNYSELNGDALSMPPPPHASGAALAQITATTKTTTEKRHRPTELEAELASALVSLGDDTTKKQDAPVRDDVVSSYEGGPAAAAGKRQRRSAPERYSDTINKLSLPTRRDMNNSSNNNYYYKNNNRNDDGAEYAEQYQDYCHNTAGNIHRVGHEYPPYYGSAYYGDGHPVVDPVYQNPPFYNQHDGISDPLYLHPYNPGFDHRKAGAAYGSGYGVAAASQAPGTGRNGKELVNLLAQIGDSIDSLFTQMHVPE